MKEDLATGDVQTIIDQLDGEPSIFYSDDILDGVVDFIDLGMDKLGLGILDEELYLLIRSDRIYSKTRYFAQRIKDISDFYGLYG